MTSDGSWPRDIRLDPFRDAVWELRHEGQVVAYLTSEVAGMRSFPFFWVRREWLWYQVNWLDGTSDRLREDYGPGWYTVADLEQGAFEPESRAGLVLDARRVGGADRDGLWEKYGPQR